MIHLTIQQISSYFDGELNPSSADLVRQHLASCEPCASKLSRLKAQGEELAGALRSDPGQAFFQQLAGEIEERIRSGNVDVAEPRRVQPKPAVPAAPAVEPAVRTAGPTMDTPSPEIRHAPSPAAPTRGGRERAAAGRAGHPVPWVAAALITVVAVSAGVMISGVGRGVFSRGGEKTPGQVAADAPEAAQTAEPAPTDGPAPSVAPAAVVRDEAAALAGRAEAADQAGPRVERDPGLIEAAEALSDGEPEAGSADAGWTDFEPVTTRADEVLEGLPVRPSGRANETPTKQGPVTRPAASGAPPHTKTTVAGSAADGGPAGSAPASPSSAADYEAAAAHWEQQLAQLRGDEYGAARYQLAEARYHAWRLAPSGDRAASAEAALRAYLVTARKGPERERATRWLSAVEEAGFR